MTRNEHHDGRLAVDRALAYAAHGWPVFPCQPGRKTPACAHGYLDASTDTGQISEWFTRHGDRNLAVATGRPGPDVLDVDKRPAGTGFAALNQLRRAGLLDGAAAWIRTPGGGLHAYFAGSEQRSGHLPGRHLDFRSAGGYVLVPPSQVGGRPYRLISAPAGQSGLDWNQATALLERADPQRPPLLPQRGPVAAADVGRLAVWVAQLGEGNRNSGLFWAACRALDAGPGADLRPLGEAARQAGLGNREISATLDSAAAHGPPGPPYRVPGGGDKLT